MTFTPKFVDMVRNLATVQGTGAVTLGTAVSGYASLAGAVSSGDQFYYCIQGVDKPQEREVGRGTMQANGTVSRQAISGALTNFTSGTKTIALVAAAEWFDKLDLVASGAGSGSTAGAWPAGLFSAAASATIPATNNVVETIGYAEVGRGAARYIFDAGVDGAFVTANPRTSFVSANGRGFRLDHRQRLTAEMFGARGDYVSKANRGTDNHAALLAATTFMPIGLKFSPEVHLGEGVYYCSATLEPHCVFALSGVPHASASDPVVGFASTRIIWPTNTRCIEVVSANTTGDTTGSGIASAAMSRIRYLCVEQETDGSGNIGTDLSAHAIHCRAPAWIEACTYENIAGDGERFAAEVTAGGALEGEASNWVSIANYAHNCGGNGHSTRGNDANIGYCRGFRTKTCGLAGIRDDSGYVNVYVQAHIAGYGTTGVHYAGRAWQPIADSSNQAPATGPYWYDRGPLAAPNATFPAWNSATAYKAKGPVIAGSPATFSGIYIEGGGAYGFAHAPNGSVFGPNMGWTMHSNIVAPTAVGMASVKGIGHYRGTGGDATHPLYSEIGDEEFTILGGDFSFGTDILARRALRLHRCKDNSLFEYYVGKDIVTDAAGRRALSISGKGTAKTFGRTTIQEGVLTLHDFALQDSNDANNARIMGLRDAAPASGYHARGEFYFNVNPSASGTIGWSCTTSGTPGTFTAVPVAGFGGTYVGDSSFSGGTLTTSILFAGNGAGYGNRIAEGGGIIYSDNQKPGTGFGYDIIHRTGRAHEFHCDPSGDLGTAPALVADVHTSGIRLQAGKVLKVGGNQVVGARGAAVADATDAASAITQLNALLARCRAHGLIA